MSPLRIDKISLELFNTTLARYPDTASSALTDLDTLRYETIPAKVEEMKGEKYLLKADVEKLVEWKLKHGTYRPALMNLVKSNTTDLIKSTTQEAFTSLEKDEDVMRALKILTQLRGIGPATASLLLNVYSPDEVPFFSDELFRWTHWGSPGKTGLGWQRSIKYSVTEYKEILASVEAVRKRLGVKAVDVEKVAYVLGKERAELDLGVENEKDAEVVEGQKNGKNRQEESKVEGATAEAKELVNSSKKKIGEGNQDGNTVETAGKRNGRSQKEEKGEKNEVGTQRRGIGKEQALRNAKGTKRKAQEEQTPAEGLRRSSRKKP